MTRREEGMSEAYLSTGTMAWPGEEETDYNKKVPLYFTAKNLTRSKCYILLYHYSYDLHFNTLQEDAWDMLKLPIGPRYSLDTFEEIDQLANLLKPQEVISLSLSLSTYLSNYLFIFLFVYLFISINSSQYVCESLNMHITFFFCTWASVSSHFFPP